MWLDRQVDVAFVVVMKVHGVSVVTEMGGQYGKASSRC